ncbi:hypothetical protein NKI94_07010 [Mesorhizobium australicum]|uniref:hypothetical protein n=1 Tax=Mesorhizobium australicum TaxID=536018 RepID=UPI00333BBD81
MTPTEYYEQELGQRRARWEEDMFLPSLFEAVQLCQVWQITLPEWAALATLNVIVGAYNESTGVGTEGAHGSAGGRTRMDYAHWLRWKSVGFVMRRHGLTELPDAKRGRPKAGETTRQAIFEEAADRLMGNQMAKPGRAETVEESFALVEDSLSRGEQRFRFDTMHTFPG